MNSLVKAFEADWDRKKVAEADEVTPGEIKKKLDVHAHAFSAAAKEKIEAAGGSCHTLEP